MFSSERAYQLSITDLKVKWPLHFAFSCVEPLHSGTNEEQQKKCLCNQLLETFRFAILGFVIPNQYCQDARKV